MTDARCGVVWNGRGVVVVVLRNEISTMTRRAARFAFPHDWHWTLWPWPWLVWRDRAGPRGCFVQLPMHVVREVYSHRIVIEKPEMTMVL